MPCAFAAANRCDGYESKVSVVIYEILNLFLTALWIAIIARAILSWFDRGMRNPISQFVYRLTEPIIAPIRQIMPRTGFIDFSPLVAIIIIAILRQMLSVAASG